MKINKLKEVIKSFPDDMEILAGEEGLIDVSCNYQRDFGMDRCFWQLMKYTGKTPEEFEEDYLYIELGGV